MTQTDLLIIRNVNNCIVCQAASGDNFRWFGVIKVQVGDYFSANLFTSLPVYTSSNEALEAMSKLVKEIRNSS